MTKATKKIVDHQPTDLTASYITYCQSSPWTTIKTEVKADVKLSKLALGDVPSSKLKLFSASNLNCPAKTAAPNTVKTNNMIRVRRAKLEIS